MHTLPPAMILLLRPFAPLFSKRVWLHVQVLLAGAILTPAHRTVTASLTPFCPKAAFSKHVCPSDRHAPRPDHGR